MVYGRYNKLVFMGFINQLITGGHLWESCHEKNHGLVWFKGKSEPETHGFLPSNIYIGLSGENFPPSSSSMKETINHGGKKHVYLN